MDIKGLFRKIWYQIVKFFKEDALPIIVKSVIEVLMEEYGTRALPSDYEKNKRRLMIKAKVNLASKGHSYSIPEKELDKAFNKALLVMNDARKNGENPVKYYEKTERIC